MDREHEVPHRFHRRDASQRRRRRRAASTEIYGRGLEDSGKEAVPGSAAISRGKPHGSPFAFLPWCRRLRRWWRHDRYRGSEACARAEGGDVPAVLHSDPGLGYDVWAQAFRQLLELFHDDDEAAEHGVITRRAAALGDPALAAGVKRRWTLTQ